MRKKLFHAALDRAMRARDAGIRFDQVSVSSTGAVFLTRLGQETEVWLCQQSHTSAVMVADALGRALGLPTMVAPPAPRIVLAVVKTLLVAVAAGCSGAAIATGILSMDPAPTCLLGLAAATAGSIRLGILCGGEG